jgi:tetratricopeptide (TPR) repeat protein
MELKPAICPNCGGDLRLPEDKKILKCMYCGKDIVVSEAIEKAVGPNIENLLVLAKSAFSSGNNKEAYDYFTKVIEINPSHYEAWFGKGANAGWLSTLADFRFPEMITGFENALKYCPQEKTEEMKLKSAEMINRVAIALYKLNINHMFEFGRSTSEKERFYNRCGGIVRALELACSYSPTDKQIIENIINICKKQIEGVEYKEFNQFGQITQKSHITKQYAQTLRLKMDENVSKRRALDPLCPICRVPLSWIPQYNRWYCYTDKKYL